MIDIPRELQDERPYHRHTCVTGKDANGQPEGHTWLCNSPYCSRLVRKCVTHGGEAPIDATLAL